mgnify:FL=1
MRGPAGFAAGSQGPGGGVAPAAAAGGPGWQQQQQQALGACPTCGGLLMLQGGASGAGSGPSSVVCEDGVCSYRLGLPHAVASVCVSGEQCQRCRHGQVMKAALRLRMALLPPGAHACLLHRFLPSYLHLLYCTDASKQAYIHAAGQQQPGWGYSPCCLECRHATMLTCPPDCIWQGTSSIGCVAKQHTPVRYWCCVTHQTDTTMCCDCAVCICAGLFHQPDYTGCLVCDPALQELLQMSGAQPNRPRAAAAAAAGVPASAATAGSSNPPAGGWQQQQQYSQPPPRGQQWQQQPSQQQPPQQHHNGAVPRTMIPPPMVSQFPADDWGIGQAAKVRKQGGAGSKKGSGGSSRAKGGSGGTKARGSKASKAAGGAAAAAAGSSGGAPLCPQHGEPVRVGTSNTAKNPGRQFYKCARPAEEGGEACLKFVWADEYQPAPQQQQAAASRGRACRGAAAAAAGAAGGTKKRGAATAKAGSKRAATAAAAATRHDDSGGWIQRGGGGGGGWQGDGGQFVTATGAPANVCFKCNQPGHWASNCPNS